MKDRTETNEGRRSLVYPQSRHRLAFLQIRPSFFDMVNGGVELHSARHARLGISTVKVRGKNVIAGVQPKDYRKIYSIGNLWGFRMTKSRRSGARPVDHFKEDK